MKYGRLFTLFTEEFGYWPTKTRCSKLPYNEAKKMCSTLYNSAKKKIETENTFVAYRVYDMLHDFTRTKNGEIQKLLYNSLKVYYR